MNRFLLFVGDTYYPGGGWDDFKGSFNTIEECKDLLKHMDYDWWHIVDSTTGKRIDE